MNRARPFVLLPILVTLACGGETPRQTPTQTAAPAPAPAARSGLSADAEKGKAIIAQYGCNVCHVIPGTETGGALGPSLAGIASRPAISYGVVPNTPANLAQYIQNPPSMNPQSAMPALGITDEEARVMAAYLMTLK